MGIIIIYKYNVIDEVNSICLTIYIYLLVYKYIYNYIQGNII